MNRRHKTVLRTEMVKVATQNYYSCKAMSGKIDPYTLIMLSWLKVEFYKLSLMQIDALLCFLHCVYHDLSLTGSIFNVYLHQGLYTFKI